jgi:hypothetical protein
MFPSGRIGEKTMTDRYTKCVLTIIAVSLGAIAIQNAVAGPAVAQSAPQRVQICGANGQCADVSGGYLWVRE